MSLAPTMTIRFSGDEKAVKKAYKREIALKKWEGKIIRKTAPRASTREKYQGSWTAYITVLV